MKKIQFDEEEFFGDDENIYSEKVRELLLEEDELSTAKGDDLAVCLFYEGSECYKILSAAVKDFSESGFEIQTNMQALEELNELKDKLKSLQKIRPCRLPKRYFPNA